MIRSKAVPKAIGFLLALTCQDCFGFVIPKSSKPKWVGLSFGSMESSTENGDFPFDEMKKFDQRLDALEECAPIS